MNTISAEQFNKIYGQQGAALFPAPTSNSRPTISQAIANSFKGGVDEAKQGLSQIANGNGNPLNLIEGAGKVGAGVISSASSPLTPITKPIGDVLQKSAEGYASLPIVQKFAGTKAGEVTSRVAEDVANFSTIAGTIGGGIETPKAGAAINDSARQALVDVTQKGKNVIKPFQSMLKNDLINKQDVVDLKTSIDPQIMLDKVQADPKFGVLLKEAQKQGFSNKDINFLATVSPVDKPVLQKMFDLTVKAQNDPRQIVRAGDVLGDTVAKQVEQVRELNHNAGAAVDQVAKTLKGAPVNVEPLKQTIGQTLENHGISMAEDGTLDFNNSVFKNTPTIQKEIQKVISSVPDGSDAYQLHIFKKSLDEMVNYGTAGEGLSGASANILKTIRNSTDGVLDNTFDSYDQANTAYKYTRDFIDQAKTVAGKNVDLGSKEGAQAFGQGLRSAFSNNKSRGNVLKFIENTQKVGKELGLAGSDQNILDQALFVNMLEDTFGSEAATGLAGEVSKAISHATTAAKVLKNPVKGGLGVIADKLEKAQNITPEAKKQVLRLFIKQ